LKNSPRFVAILRLHPDAAREIRMWRMAMESTPDAGSSPREGWTTLRVQFEDEHHAAFVARAFGARAEVLAPASLRDRLVSELEASLHQYESTSGSHV
jgi:predicted DNA-binding transcriptional regulator YafY